MIINQYIYSFLIISCIIALIILYKTFCQVETETVNMIFIHQEFQVTLEMCLNHWLCMVEIVEHTCRMRCIYIKPWIVRGSLIVFAIPIKFCKRMCSCSMIEHNIKNNCHVTFMTFVYKHLVHVFSTVCLIKGKIETWIISPAVVPVEFLYRHQLYCCYSKLLKIVKLLDGTMQILRFGEIAKKKFINHKTVSVFNSIIMRPWIFFFTCLKYGYSSRSFFRIFHFGRRISTFFDIGITLAIENLF